MSGSRRAKLANANHLPTAKEMLKDGVRARIGLDCIWNPEAAATDAFREANRVGLTGKAVTLRFGRGVALDDPDLEIATRIARSEEEPNG